MHIAFSGVIAQKRENSSGNLSTRCGLHLPQWHSCYSLRMGRHRRCSESLDSVVYYELAVIRIVARAALPYYISTL